VIQNDPEQSSNIQQYTARVF